MSVLPELWREHQQHTGVWNEQLYNARPANQGVQPACNVFLLRAEGAGCFPTTTTWWQTTKAIELLKKVITHWLTGSRTASPSS